MGINKAKAKKIPLVEVPERRAPVPLGWEGGRGGPTAGALVLGKHSQASEAAAA